MSSDVSMGVFCFCARVAKSACALVSATWCRPPCGGRQLRPRSGDVVVEIAQLAERRRHGTPGGGNSPYPRRPTPLAPAAPAGGVSQKSVCETAKGQGQKARCLLKRSLVALRRAAAPPSAPAFCPTLCMPPTLHCSSTASSLLKRFSFRSGGHVPQLHDGGRKAGVVATHALSLERKRLSQTSQALFGAPTVGISKALCATHSNHPDGGRRVSMGGGRCRAAESRLRWAASLAGVPRRSPAWT